MINLEPLEPEERGSGQWRLFRRLDVRGWEVHPNLDPKKIYPLLLEFCHAVTLSVLVPEPLLTSLRIWVACWYFLKSYPISARSRKQTIRKYLLRKSKDFKPKYQGHMIALDTIERFIHGCRRYVITFEDIYTRFSFALAPSLMRLRQPKSSVGSLRKFSPIPLNFSGYWPTTVQNSRNIFNEELRRLNMTHYHTYLSQEDSQDECPSWEV